MRYQLLMKDVADAKKKNQPQIHTVYHQQWFYTLGLEEHCQVQTGLIPLISKQVIPYSTEDWSTILRKDAPPKVDEYLHNQ